ncbi:MAG: S8 family serine peptidase, partial [Planctomycetes bacterium]|nr:S8 family serine peptidase [Planctomycetota bacterium]
MPVRRLVASILVFAGFGAAVHAQDPATADPRFVHVDRLSVKLAEGTGAELVDGVLRSRSGVDLSRLQPLFAAGHAQPLVTAVPWDELDRWHRHACAVLPEHNRPGHLGLWFRLVGDSAAATAALQSELRREPLVTHADFEPVYALAAAPGALAPPQDLPPTTPLFTSLQLTHDPNPVGHGVRQAAGIFGARGRDVKFVMMENSFVLDHEDVEQLVAANFLGPVPAYDPTFALHGVSGAAITCATRNGYGITGVADEVTARFMSLNLNGGVENCLAMAVADTQPGDVVMVVIIVQVPYLGPNSWVPFEIFQSAFDATLTTTALGRHVVVPAGNGNLSLDDPVFLNRFDRNFRDSGAIFVGASQAGLMQRATFANWGSRVDCHSWGDQVTSCGYSTLFFPNNDLRQSYTNGASGTSASTPSLAGVVAMVQGAAKKQLGTTLSNAQMRDLLRMHGATTPDLIGPRSDVPAILQALGVFDGLSVDRADLQLLDTMTVTMSGAPGDLAALFA